MRVVEIYNNSVIIGDKIFFKKSKNFKTFKLKKQKKFLAKQKTRNDKN